MFTSKLVLLQTAVAVVLGGTCAHDRVRQATSMSNQTYSNHPFDFGRRLATADFAPIRITLHFEQDSSMDLTAEQKDFLQNDLLPHTVAVWEKSLSVVPVNGNLFAERTCMEWYETPNRVCKTVASDQKCFEADIPAEHFAPKRVCNECTNSNDCQGNDCTIMEGTGVPNADFVLYVNAKTTAHCGHKVLAYAASCQRDQHDRPTFGMVNFCPSELKHDPSMYQKQLNTALHEIIHALGFSSDLYAYMRDEAGNPRTGRNDAGDVPRSNVECPSGQTLTNFAMPANNTLQFFYERGHYVSKLVTPNVLNYVRNHFGCAELNGAELEDQEGSCIGSHWEERIFEPEFMTAVQSVHNVVSGLTLAYFEDTGWYKANHSMAEPNYFGAKRGCKFAYSKCVDNYFKTPTPVDEDHFCTTEGTTGCTIDGLSKAVCSYKENVGKTIPPIYRYFDSLASGGAEYNDFCPIYTGYASGSCSNQANLFHPPGTELNIQGETYCENCKCTKSTLHSKDASQWQLVNGGSGCYDIQCDAGRIDITIPRNSGGSVTASCDQKGEQVTVEGFTGHLYCPDPYVMCNQGQCDRDCGKNALCVAGGCQCLSGYVPDHETGDCKSACLNGCSGRGRCAMTGTCQCNTGYKGDDCSEIDANAVGVETTADTGTFLVPQLLLMLLCFIINL